MSDPRAFGCVPTDSEGRVTAFLEKTQDPPTDQINAGCYVFARDIIDRIPRGREVSVEREVFPALLSDPTVKVCGYVDATYWRDMGTPEDFVRGSADLVRGSRRHRRCTVTGVSNWCTTAPRWRRVRC